MKRTMITLFLVGVFVISHAKTNYDISFRDIILEYNQPQTSFIFSGSFSSYDYHRAEEDLNTLLTETYGIECAYAYVEAAEGMPGKTHVEIYLCDNNYSPTPRVYHIECHLFYFTLIHKGLTIQDANISKSGSLVEGNANVIFNNQLDVGYYLYCNGSLIQEIPCWGGGVLKSIPVTQDGIYTLEGYVLDQESSEHPYYMIQGPVALSGSVSFFDHLTPFGGTISGPDWYFRGGTNTVAVIGTSGGSGGPSGSNYSYSWERRNGSNWETIPNQTDVNYIVNVTGQSTDIYLRRKVTKSGRIAYSNVHKISSKTTSSVYANLNSITKTAYTSENEADQMQSIEYFNGLGRLMQVVQVGATPTRADLVSHQEYDAFGRESNSWLPVPAVQNNGAFISINNYINLTSDTYEGDLAPYSKTFYEPSPLNRIEQQFGPGHVWYNNSGSVKTNYMTNIAGNDTLNCIYYTISDPDTQSISLTNVRNYHSNELYVTRIEDEDGGVQFHFKDKLDNLILVRQLERKVNGRRFADIYYVYDVFNNLRIVLPPLASEQLIYGSTWSSSSTAFLSDYAYLYKYDGRGRCIAKKLPGVSWTYFIYDHADRKIFSQDGEQRGRNQWYFVIPDVFGRESLIGLCSNSFNPFNNPLDNIVVNAQRDLSMDISKGYRVNGISLSTPVVLTANYYDDYAFKVQDGAILYTSTNSIFRFEVLPDFDIEHSSAVGLPTGRISARLTGTGSNISADYDCVVMYYDNEERLIQTRSTNHLGGYDNTFIAYNFIGQPTRKRHIHSASGQTTQNELYTYSYDHARRLLIVRHKLNNADEIILTDNEYDELGRLKKNRRNGRVGLTTSYTYNIRSWIQDMFNAHFVQNLSYTSSGNIRIQEWQQSGKTRKYEFSYDPLSRLVSSSCVGDGNYGTNYTYDKQGNITSLSRWGNTGANTYGLIDDLVMTYHGNQLTKVEDMGTTPNLSSSADFRNGSTSSVEYTYDANGNMTKDLNKGISNIQYNSLNLLSSLTISNGFGSATNTYVYSSTGSKLSVSKNDFNTVFRTDYVGNMIYENGVFKHLLVDGGYYQAGAYYFYTQDHLGNNRIVANQNADVVQSTQYYPFGMAYADGTGQSVQPYKYNGKELDGDRGLNWYDYDARYTDVALGRFTTMDPHAENYYSWSPYVYVGGNPMKCIDPTGMDWYSYIDKNGKTKYEWNADIRSQKDLDKIRKDATYLNRTYTQNDTYYSLLGDKYNLNTYDAKIIQKMEESLLNFYDELSSIYNEQRGVSEDIRHDKLTDFDIGLYKDGDFIYHEFDYQGATVYYYRIGPEMENKGKFREWGSDDYYRANKNRNAGNMKSGYPVDFIRTRGNAKDGARYPETIKMIFPTSASKANFYNNVRRAIK